MPAHEILLGVTAGIAAYKAADLTSRLVKAGHQVTVVQTKNSLNFIGSTTFEALTNRPVYVEQYLPQEHHLGEHIGLARRADLMIISPASANILAKMAHGIADDLLTTLALAVECPVLMAPAMNTQMWSKPSVQRNIKQLIEDGFEMVGPEEGWLSCRIQGAGRMTESEELFQVIEEKLKQRS